MSDQRPFPSGSRVAEVDLSGVHLHDVNLEGARLTDAILCDTEISGDIEGLRINDVEVEPLIRAELDRRFPERIQLRARDLENLRQAWSMLEGRWAETTARAADLPEDLQVRRVNDEWSFVETLRHLICATDCWLFRGIRLERHPYHPWGLAWTGAGPEWSREIGLDPLAAPGLAEVLAIREEHQRAVRSTLDTLSEQELGEVRTPPDEPGHPNGEHSVLHCLHVVLNEEWEHHRYAVRDLDQLEGGPDRN
jgi:hypothetical protein